MSVSQTEQDDVSANATKRSTVPITRLSTIGDPRTDAHLNGDYFRNHPTWHVEYSPLKAINIRGMLERHQVKPRTICEVGCGAGEVLRQLQMKMDPECRFWGYDVAPPAIEIAKQRENERLLFDVADFGMIDTPYFDLLLALEVVDHVENYFEFLRMLKRRAEWKLFSFSLDISVQSVLRTGELTRRREFHSHLHQFTKETALSALRYTGHEVVAAIYPPSLPVGTLAKLAKPIRQAIFSLNQEFATRMFGGYPLMVLTR